MPNAAASLDADFARQAYDHRKPTRGAPRKKAGKRSGKLRSAMLSRVPRFGAIAISALIGVGIIVNALMMQHGHHPAPLFAASAVATADAAPAKAQPAIPAAARPEAAKPPAPQTAEEARPVAHAAAAKAMRGDDAIARLIGGSQVVPPSRKVKTPAKAVAAKPAPVKVAQDKRRKMED